MYLTRSYLDGLMTDTDPLSKLVNGHLQSGDPLSDVSESHFVGNI